MVKSLALFLAAASLSAELQIPNRFSILETPVVLPTSFEIVEPTGSLGHGVKRILAITPTFDLYDSAEKLVAVARARLLCWGIIADVVDVEGKSVGCIEEDVWRTYPWPEYKIFDANKRLIALACMDPLEVELTLFDPDDRDHVFAKLERPPVSVIGDHWTVEVLEPKIDPRLLIFLALYQTNRDLRYY